MQRPCMFFFFLALSLSHFAFAEEVDSEFELHKTTLVCPSKIEATVYSLCSADEAHYKPCLSQSMVIHHLDRLGEHVTSPRYVQFNDLDDPKVRVFADIMIKRIVKLSCVKGNDARDYLIAYITSGGNCQGFESVEIIDPLKGRITPHEKNFETTFKKLFSIKWKNLSWMQIDFQ